MESSTGLSSADARASASSPHGYQSTGFSACCSRYGLVSPARRFILIGPERAGAVRCANDGPPLVNAARLGLRRFLERDTLEVGAALNEARQPEFALGTGVDRAQRAAW